MQIISLTPVADRGGGRFRTLAHFDLQLTPQVRLYGMRLLEDERGRRLSYAPSSGGRRFATFDGELASEITTAAIQTYEGRETANDRINR